MPTCRRPDRRYMAAALGNWIYVIGGQNGGVQLTTNESTRCPRHLEHHEPMPSPRAEMGVVSHGGQIYYGRLVCLEIVQPEPRVQALEQRDEFESRARFGGALM